MKHYLNVCDVDGASVEPVDVITFGSPCQSLSVAGKREGLKHTAIGDAETTRSGLFIEAVRIIKEMRKADETRQLSMHGPDFNVRMVKPRWAVWENVPGAFSSANGQDFRCVLEELARVKDAEVSIPLPEKGKWKPAGEIVGDGWSIAWRTLDAQYHGTPQRRRRIFLIADFADECAGEILFECQGLRGYPTEIGQQGQGSSRNPEDGIRGSNHMAFRKTAHPRDSRGGQGYESTEVTDTLNVFDTTEARTPTVIVEPMVIDMTHANDVVRVSEDGVVPTLQHRMGTGGNQVPLIAESMAWDGTQVSATLTARNAGGSQRMPDKENFNCVIQHVSYAFYPQMKAESQCWTEEVSPCLVIGTNAGYQNGIVQPVHIKEAVRWIVRRLTPTECARLQGMPDEWCRLSHIDDMSDEDYDFWQEAHKCIAAVNGKKYTPKSKEQMVKWYNNLQTDGAEYKAYGNGMALPCVRVPMHGIAQRGAKTMASLFDGIGGFPLAGLLDGIETLWTSEIELFPIAVTTERFREYEKHGRFTYGKDE